MTMTLTEKNRQTNKKQEVQSSENKKQIIKRLRKEPKMIKKSVDDAQKKTCKKQGNLMSFNKNQSYES